MLNDDTLQLLIKKYTIDNYNLSKLAKEYKMTRYKVKKILKENNIEIRDIYYYTRKYKIDANAFDNIDTEDKAYMLGFICADGCIYDNKSLAIGIHKRDIMVLMLLKRILNCETLPIRNHSKNKNHIIIQVWNKQLVASLKKLGIVERKTFTISMPRNMPENLHKHFWRGVIDGDGCVFLKERINNRNKPTFTVTLIGSRFLMEDYVDFLKSLNITPLPKIKPCKSIWSVVICSKNAIMFCEKIYNDSDFCLQRKKEKFLNAVEMIKKQQRKLPKGMFFVGKKKKIKVAALLSAGFDKEYHIGIFHTLEEALKETSIFYRNYNKKYIPDYGDWR